MPRSFFNRRNIFLTLSLFHLSIYVVLGLLPGLFASNPDPKGLQTLVPLVPFSAGEINVEDAFQPPSWCLSSHFLGTDNLGRDILAGIIYGCQTSLWVGFPSMLLATFIGLALGLLAGYFGNTGNRATIVSLVLYLVAFFLSWFYGFYLQQFAIIDAFDKGAGAA